MQVHCCKQKRWIGNRVNLSDMAAVLAGGAVFRRRSPHQQSSSYIQLLPQLRVESFSVAGTQHGDLIFRPQKIKLVQHRNKKRPKGGQWQLATLTPAVTLMSP